MAETKWTLIEDFSPGFVDKRDITQIPAGALILGSKNVVITDGDRIGVRGGSEIFGATSSTLTGIGGLHTFKRRDGVQIMMRPAGAVMEYYHPDTAAWENLNSSYNSSAFGFADHNINTDATSYTYFCNARDPYSRWTGQFTMLNGALAGGEATVTVDTVLQDEVYHSDTASACTTTTITIATAKWSTNLWNNFYVLIKDGAQAGKISKISATTSTQITFAVIAGLAGTPAFEIRKVAYNDTSDLTLRIGTSNVTYTGFGSQTTFTGCSGTPAAADNAAVTQAVKEYPSIARGNILWVLNTRMFVGGVMGKESSIFYSKIADATDFSFSATRAANEGGVIDTPEGGGGLLGTGLQEDTIYAIKRDIIKTITFTNDENDFPVIKPLIDAPGVGAASRLGVFKVDNQLMYVAADGGLKSVGRVAQIDFVQPLQTSDPIAEFIKTLDLSNAAGFFHKQKAYISVMSADGSSNDLTLVYNFQKQAWEAPIYGLAASCWTEYYGDLYFGSPTQKEVYKAFPESVYDDLGAPYECVARFAYNNYQQPALPKHFNMLFMEGYIGENTTIAVKVRYNYLGGLETREGSLAGTETTYLISGADYNLLGNQAIGLNPLGSLVDEADAPTDLQKFRIYFTTGPTSFYEISVEVSSDAVGARWEVLRFGTNAGLDLNPVKNLTKKLA